MQNWDKYILIGLIVVVLFILTKMNKVMGMQTTLMIGMAQKMGVTGEIEFQSTRQAKAEHVEEAKEKEEEETEDKDEAIVRIALRVYSGKAINKKDKEFYEKFKKDIDEEAGFFLEDDMTRIAQAIKAGNELTQEDADLYISNLPAFQERLQLPNITVPIIPSIPKDIVELETEQDRKHLMLTFFDDGDPKTRGALAKSYADKTGLAVSEGNTSKLLDKLLEEKKLMNQKILHNSRNKVFYGLPHWFDGKKFLKEYLKKINQ